MIASIQSDSEGDTLYPIRQRYIFSYSQLDSHASFDTQISGPYHACTTINAQVIIGFNERKQGKYRMNFAMSLNIFYISRLLIIDQFTWRAQRLRLRMQRESLVPLFSFSLSFLCLLFFFFAIYSKASSFPVSLLRLHISISHHLQFFYSSQEHVVGSQSPQTPLLYDNERL